jgi:signal transduction histidine kinase
VSGADHGDNGGMDQTVADEPAAEAPEAPEGRTTESPDERPGRTSAARLVAGVERLAETSFDAAAAAFRRMYASPDWPLYSGLLLGLGAVVEIVLYTTVGPAQGQGPEALVLNLVATVPLAMRRHHLKLAAVLVTTSSILLFSGTAMWTLSGLVGQVWVLYLIAAHCRPRVSVMLSVPFLIIALSSFGGPGTSLGGLLMFVSAIAALVIGDARQRQDEAIAERDATRQAMADTLRGQAVMGERARIARDLHDVVAHHISMIAVQAETARLTTENLPDDGKASLDAIAGTARDALTEMRRLLGVLREDAGDGAVRAPQPGLAQLDDLIEAARVAGSAVRLAVEGEPMPLAAGVDLAAYRIVQEALTNARRHAPGASVEIDLRYGNGNLVVQVADDGPGTEGTAAEGHGLLGMRERAIMVGGDLEAGPGPDGGFMVQARLPMSEAPL